MTKKQSEMIGFLSKFKSCTDEQLIFFTQGTKQDINYLINENLIVRDEKTKILYLKIKKLDVRTVVALDVVKLINDDIKNIGYSRNFPVIFTILTKDNLVCDIAVIRNIEQDTVFKRLKMYSNADKLIIILENNSYDRRKINSDNEILICTYPIKIIDKIN